MTDFGEVLMSLADNSNNKPSTSSSPLITTETNLTNAEGKATYVPSYKPVTIRPESADEVNKQMFSNLAAQMSALGDEKDPEKKANALIAFKGAAAETFAKISGQARTLAETQAGIPLLMQEIRRAEMLDRQDPLYSQHMVDSRETMMLKDRLVQAQERAGIISKRMLAENPAVASMSTQIDSFIKLNEALIAKDMNRQDTQQQKVDEFMNVISPDVKKDVWAIRPDLKGNDAATSQFLMQELKLNKKDWEPILSGSLEPKDYLLNGLAGNKVAAAMAVKKQVEASGLPEDMVLKQARVLNDFVNNPAAADKIIKDFNLFTSPKEMKAYQALGMKPGKEGALEQAKVRMSLVETLASRLAVGSLSNNIDKWPVAPGKLGIINLPEAGPIFEDFQKTAGRKPNVEEFFNAFVNKDGLAPEERVKRSQMIQGAYAEVLKKAAGGFYGTEIDVVGLTNRLAIKGALRSMPNINSWR